MLLLSNAENQAKKKISGSILADVWVIPAQLKQGCTPYVMDFFLIKGTDHDIC